jgi:predicted PurR-regulated permease PerM
MAALQGALAGLAFWLSGVTSAGLGIVTALCALSPLIGTGIVLLPAVSMLMFRSHWMKVSFSLPGD